MRSSGWRASSAWRVAVFALFLFGWLADEMLEGSTMALDLRVRAATQALASPGLTHTLRLVRRLGGPPCWRCSA